MQKSVALIFLLLHLSSLAETAVPPSVQKYLEVLRKRPEPGTIFERFYSSWQEEGTASGLLEHLSAQASRPDAAASDHLILALFHSHRGDDLQALTAYHAALQLDDKNAGAWLERARIESRLLDFPAALGSLEKASSAKPSPALALDIARLKGRALIRLARNDDALALWRDMVQKNADHEDLIEEIIDWFADEAQYEAALETSRALVKRTRDPLARTLRQLRLADILLMADRSDESLTVLDTALFSTGAETWIESDVLSRIERVFRRADDVAGLEKHLAALVLANPQRVTLGWQHALLLAATGRAEDALDSARALLKSNPGRRDLQNQFLDLLESLNQTPEAIAQAQDLSGQNPADRELLIRLAALQQRAGEISAASCTLDAYLASAGADEAALLRVARIQEGWEKPPAKEDSPAFKTYARLRAAFPASLSAQEACAHYLHRSGRREEALAIWKRLAKNATLEDLLRIGQSLQARLESRSALDILSAREADFSRQPRFLGLLVKSAIANEESARALPWALAHLRLMQDAEGIEGAMAPLRILLQPKNAGLAAPLVEELQHKDSLIIQDRCLLAMLLHQKGDSSAAAQLLAEAPAADATIALVQLATLQQAGKDWAAAAETLQKVIALPGGRTPARLQLLVDVLRRANLPAQALPQISIWKMLTPSAVEPWLVEARVLGELYRNKDVLTVLRQAVRKFPDAVEPAHAYATACLGAGDAAEAERIYLALYEKTTDTEARLRLLPPLALAAQRHGALAPLVENFQRRQRQNRASALPWLALAEIHRAVQNREEHLRCLYEASRLRPQDMSLLLEIARHEEAEGLYAEAVRTLEAAAKLDKTTKVRERLAKLQIENGDPDAGYHILFDLAGGGQMSPEAVEQIADAMALRGDWKNIPDLLQPLLEKHPRHYRLHYLCGVAQEESGQNDAAVLTFLRVMDMHEEIPGTPPVIPPGETGALPAGTEDWLRFAEASAMAYAYQEKSRDLQYSWRQTVSAPPSLISLPADVHQAPAFAMAHVLRLASTLPENEQQRIVVQLRHLGIADAALLLEAALSPAAFSITPALLEAHPSDTALHAAWLLSPETTDDVAALERCFELFKGRHPELALIAADQILQQGGVANNDLWVTRLILLGSSLPHANARTWEPFARLLWSQFPELSSPPPETPVYLTPEETEKIVALLRRWMGTSTSLESVSDITTALLAHDRWDAAIEGFERMFELASASASGTPQVPPPPSGPACRPPRPWDAAPLPLIAADTGMPSSVISLLEPVLISLHHEEASRDDESNILSPLFRKSAAGEEEIRQRVQQFQAAARRRAADAPDAHLRLFLRLLSGDARTLLTEQEARIKRPDATLQNFLFAGWLQQLLQEDEKALQTFQSAAKLAQDPPLLALLNSARLWLAFHTRQEGDGGSELASGTARQILGDIVKSGLTHEEKWNLLPFLETAGMADEAEKVRHSLLTTPQAAQHFTAPPAPPNPYSALLASGRRGGAQDLLDRFLLQDNDSGALAEASRRARQLTARWLGSTPVGNEAKSELITLLMKLGMHELREPFLTRLKADAAADWEKRQAYAAMLEMQHAHGRVFQNNDGARSLTVDELYFRAVQEYEAVLTANPQADSARRRLVMLQAVKDPAVALRHWKALPEALQPTLLFPLTDRACDAKDAAQITAITRIITSWLKSLDPDRPVPSRTRNELGFVLEKIEDGSGWPSLNAVFGPGRDGQGTSAWEFDANGMLKLDEALRRQRNDRRIAHEALCRAMTRFPELAEMGFAPLAGLAIFEQRDLPGMEQLALQILSLRGSQTSAQRQVAPRPPPSGSNRLFENEILIAHQPSAFFATWSAARRGDVRSLEDIIYPAILKADGPLMLDFCRGYAAVLLADNARFTAAASAWVRRWLTPTLACTEAFHPGGMAHEVVRLWEARKNADPLDDLFLSFKALVINPRDAMDNNPLVLAPTPYVRALLKRDPADVRRFLLRMREEWISPDAGVRRQAMARYLANEAGRSSHRNTPTERAAGSCLEWLNFLMTTEASQAAFEAAVEDGGLNAKEWVSKLAAQPDEIHTPGGFLILLRQLGYLRGDAGPRLLSEEWDQPGHPLRLALTFRDSGGPMPSAALVELLGRHQPSGLDTHLLQAMFVLEEIKSIRLDGRSVTLVAPPSCGPLTRREMAYRLVILRHAAEIAALPVEERNAFGSFLEMEQPRLLRPSPDDAEFRQALEPVIQATKQASKKADAKNELPLETRKP